MDKDRLITIAIYTYEKAQIIKGILENEDIPVAIQNVNLIQPVISSGVRVRIREQDLPHALQILEQYAIFGDENAETAETAHVKRILIPVDFSDYSFKACQIGFDFARNIEAEVMLLHAYYSPYYPNLIPISDTFAYNEAEEEEIKRIHERVEGEMQSFVTALHKRIEDGLLPEIPFDSVLRKGVPEDEILRFSKEYRPTLVIMGTRGRSQKEIDLIGSVTAEVLDSTKFPVFAIPENIPFSMVDKINNIAFFTNFDQRDLIALDTFMRLFGGFGFKITFVHISARQDAWNEIKLAGIKSYFNRQCPGRDVDYTLLDSTGFLEGVESLVREGKIDVLAITSRKRNIFARLFNPSMAHKMLFHSDTPLLVLPS
ncbi:MAG: universal stress protein [Coprobacter sp.]|nr:universal stress protein [Coprobacter sp.]